MSYFTNLPFAGKKNALKMRKGWVNRKKAREAGKRTGASLDPASLLPRKIT
jgi:hypothetical protein